jgi:predicted TIM-barrel fold metal-dependent hydrolase
MMLEKHPGLRVVGCHLGSLEWDVDELARCLDKFPNFAVDMAARICHFQVQDREKVQRFFNTYQDRILYGTDIIITPESESPQDLENLRGTWLRDWDYFATNKLLASPDVDNEFQGLSLPQEILRKIYYDNAKHWYPGIK